MTYSELKILTRALLSSDFPLPEDDESIKALLKMAYKYLANRCQVLNLQTEDKSAHILRLGRGTHMVRMPELPTSDDDILDIDDELCDAAACLIASYISEKKIMVHKANAEEIINSYNAKVDEFLETYAEGIDND